MLTRVPWDLGGVCEGRVGKCRLEGEERGSLSVWGWRHTVCGSLRCSGGPECAPAQTTRETLGEPTPRSEHRMRVIRAYMAEPASGNREERPSL